MGETLDKFLLPAFTPHYIFFCLVFILCEILSKPDGRALLKIIVRPLWLPCQRASLKLVKFCLLYFPFIKKALFAITPQKKVPAQQVLIGHAQSLYRLPAEVRLVVFKVFLIDRGNIAMRSLLKALRRDPILLEEAHEVYYSMKNFHLTKANQWSFDKYTSTGIEHLQLVKYITIDLQYC
jgi:hypothetical protein